MSNWAIWDRLSHGVLSSLYWLTSRCLNRHWLIGDQGERFGKNGAVWIRRGWDTGARWWIARGCKTVMGKYWLFLLYSLMPSRASTFNHFQRLVLCTKTLWMFFCFYVSFYSLCEREKVCPRVVIAGKYGQRVVPSREIWKWLSWKGRLLCSNTWLVRPP